jgi:hypothetical protein
LDEERREGDTMSEHDDTVNEEGLSRRLLLTGGIAAVAGIVASAALPAVAAADNGDVAHVGADMWGSQTGFQITSNGLPTGGTHLASTLIGRNSNAFPEFPVQGIGAVIWGTAPIGSSAVFGDAVDTNAYGIHAKHDLDAGTALKVEGRTSLSRSGIGTVTKKTSTKTVSVPTGVNSGSKIIVTLMGDGGSGVYLKYATLASATTFKVVLNKKATKSVRFSWMVTD